jgi:hypothetical protein
MINKSKFNPYCELCESCGEEGCCSHINCFSTLIKNPKCKYGQTYVKEAILNNKTNIIFFELFEKLEKDNTYTKEQFIIDFKLNYNKILEEHYSNN